MSKSKNDIAWEKIFEKYCILDKLANNERISISSTEINQFREARLMTKFDHRSQLPKLFIDHNLSILPTSRGTYEIGKFKTFCDFNKDDIEITPIDFPTFLESIDYKDITSESIAINCAFVSKILHDFTGEENLLPTVSGRMSSSVFDFTINSGQNILKINVDNSQIEIDGGYEGDSSLNLIEAKNYISDDFLIRQLYYPYRLWSNKIGKRVRPIFLTYSNGIFHLREYEFVTPELYNSIRLIQHKKYAVQEGGINVENIQNILDSIQVVKEPELPFPQADSFERVINLCELLKQKGFIPVLAHVERYIKIHDDPEIIYDCIKTGAIIQINSSSLIGKQGKEIQRFCNLLIGRNMVHLVATDAHGSQRRRPIMKDAYQYIEKKYSKEIADNLFINNAQCILDNKEIIIEEPFEKSMEKVSFLKRIFRR